MYSLILARLDGVKDTSGLTVEGWQEYYDEACLAVLNNRLMLLFLLILNIMTVLLFLSNLLLLILSIL